MKKVLKIIAIIMLVVGLCLFSYPIAVRIIFDSRANEAIEQFEQQREQTTEQVLYPELRAAMFEYNKQLYLNGQKGLIDQLSYEKPDFKLSDYGIDSDILGYISIPAIDVKLPIFNGASEENMAKGATYLANTSLPIGGDNTNCVIAGHTRWNGVYIFKRITELKVGDEIYITNFWETLVYKVAETMVIIPNDSQNIYIQPGRNLLTLTTCHPYPEKYQRYLVFAEFDRTEK